MTKQTPSTATRREFLRRTTAFAALGSAAPWALNLAAIGEAAAQSSTSSDYKALVCVFLYGGLDYGNTLIPIDDGRYPLYQRVRQNLALSKDLLAPTTLTPIQTQALDGARYAMGPGLASLLPLWKSGDMAALLNIGPLMEPTTKLQYLNPGHPKPPKLFSHNDQQSVWQSLGSSEGATSGWGGNIGELLASSNGKSNFTAINVSGNAVFVAGNTLTPFTVSAGGPMKIRALDRAPFNSAAVQSALRTLITQSNANSWLAQAHVDVVKRSISANIDLDSALAGSTPLALGHFPVGNKLADQLKMVANIINARGALNVKKQVFFVSLGGWDHHSGLMESHQPMLSEVASALSTFHTTIKSMGLNNNVISFTASDFGRTLTSNGEGSDHGWGGHHFVQGGAVNGGRFIGSPPTPGDNGPHDVGGGRMLPGISVDQLAAEFALWMGVPKSSLSFVVPRAAKFDRLPLFKSQPYPNQRFV